MTATVLLATEDRCRAELESALEDRSVEYHTACDPQSALAEARRVDPDVAVIDADMDGNHDLEVVRRMREANPPLPIIVLSSHPTVELAVSALRQAASDFLIKPGDLDHLIESVKTAVPHAEPAELSLLSPREREIFLEVLTAKSAAELAWRLHISEHTVRNHIKSIYRKLDVHSRVELVSKYLRRMR